MIAALALVLLTADGPAVHGGAELGLGAGVPFRLARAGFQFGFKPYLELEVAPRVFVGASLPLGFGFFTANGSGEVASASYTAIDIMPGLHGAFAVLDWVYAALDLGLGPNVLVSRVDINFGGFRSSQTENRTFFAMRVALEVVVVPPSLSGVTLGVVPFEILGRVGDSTFSEYRISVVVGYRR